MHAYTLLSACVFIITISILIPKPIIAVTGQTPAEQLTKLLHEGNFLYTQKKYDQALKSFKKMLALDSTNTIAMDRIGLILYNLGNVKDAISTFHIIFFVYNVVVQTCRRLEASPRVILNSPIRLYQISY